MSISIPTQVIFSHFVWCTCKYFWFGSSKSLFVASSFCCSLFWSFHYFSHHKASQKEEKESGNKRLQFCISAAERCHLSLSLLQWCFIHSMSPHFTSFPKWSMPSILECSPQCQSIYQSACWIWHALASSVFLLQALAILQICTHVFVWICRLKWLFYLFPQ